MPIIIDNADCNIVFARNKFENISGMFGVVYLRYKTNSPANAVFYDN